MAKRPAKAESVSEPKSGAGRSGELGGAGGAGGSGGAGGLPGSGEPRLTPLGRLLGQDRAVRTLRSSIATGRVHHAWIFSGPAGVGKFTAAMGFAALLLDPATGSGSDDPPADGAVQRLIASGNHPDLHVVRKERAAVSRDADVRKRKQTNIPLDVLREFLLEPAALARVMPGDSPAGKVFIVDQAELIDVGGQNALLKTLEEPPAGTVIILVTSQEDRLLPTIRSRCQRAAFAALDESSMEAWLVRSGLATPPGMRPWVLSYAGGSPGVAQTILQAGLHQWHQTLGPMLAGLDRGQFPGELGGTMAKLVDERAAAEADASASASKDAANRAWAKRLLGYVAHHYRERLRERPDERAAAAVDLLADAERQIDANVRYGDVLENLSAQLARG
jgi:DNA polymerase-3 subunit delta'